jgi:selenide,water dikinase
MGPGALAQVLRSLTLPTSPNLLIGLDVKDDAAVYQIADDLALVQTVDIFPPIVDDPYTFGAIAAANALSDIYAMGGRPILALAIAGFPEDMPPATISAILQGGADKVAEAGAVVAGGHTVIDSEPKYGLCVTGLVHPNRVTAKAHARPGDVLLLTKPLGTGVITTAHKRGVVRASDLAAAVASMTRLNRHAAELAAGSTLHSATDITGYGLLGHAAELARNSGVGLRIAPDQVPLLPGALDYASQGIFPGGLSRNREYLLSEAAVRLSAGLAAAHSQLLFDPQTSGGLLFAVPAHEEAPLIERFAAAGEPIWRIGDVVEGQGIDVSYEL